MPDKPRNHYALWSTKEVEDVIFLYNNDYPIREISEMLKRTEYSVKIKLHRIPEKLKRPYIDVATCNKTYNDLYDETRGLLIIYRKLREKIENRLVDIRQAIVDTTIIFE